MKPIHHLLILLTTFFIFQACSDSPGGTDSPYPVHVGSFTIQSETRADWTGTNSLTKSTSKAVLAVGDTVRLTRPDSLSMMVTPAYEGNGFAISINDSSLSAAFLIENDIQFEINQINDSENGIEKMTGGAVGDGLNGPVNIQFNGNYNCESTIKNDHTAFTYSLFFGSKTPENHFRTYILQTNGFHEVLNTLVCNEPI